MTTSLSFFPGRGAYKLWGALARQKIELQGRICIDLGCAVGGFTSVLLHGGGSHVYGFDIGYGLIDYALSRAKRVTIRERTDFRALDPCHFQPSHWTELKKGNSFLTADISFLSGKTILDFLSIFARRHKLVLEMLVLIKPQFNASNQTQQGILKDSVVLLDILEKIKKKGETLHFTEIKIFPSALKGRFGNQEFFFHARVDGKD